MPIQKTFSSCAGGAAGAILLLVSLVVGCAARTGEIWGPVTDEIGRPVVAARVIATNAEAPLVRETKTNTKGWFFFGDLPPGRYTLRAEAPGHDKGEVETVTVDRGRTFTQGLRLASAIRMPPPPAPPPAPGGRAGGPPVLLLESPMAIGVEGGVAGGVVGGVVGGVPGGAFVAPMNVPFAVAPDGLSLEQRYVGPMDTEAYARIDETGFLDPWRVPLSTFSVDVDTASYANTRRFLNDGRLPPKDAVRIEEFLNYFAYDYAPPGEGEAPFSIHTEVGPCPWAPEHRLVLVGLQGRPLADKDLPGRNLVFLIDVSGSMNEPRKLPLLKSALRLLARRLTAKDRVAIVVYAGSSGLVLPPTRGDRHQVILAALDRLQAGGSTNGGEGIQLAYGVAQQAAERGAVSRVILATDGDFNVGVTNLGALTRLIEEKRETGVFLSVLGFGDGNLKDTTMEALADRGNGNYSYIDTVQEARKVLVREAGGTLITIAKDVKLQVELNPRRVAGYRLLGYENRRLRDEDFKDDRKDAGEIGAGHRVTALYEIVPPGVPVETGEVDALEYQSPPVTTASAADSAILTVKLRYKDPDGDESRLLRHVVQEPASEAAEPSMDFEFASAVAEFAMLLRESEHRGKAGFGGVIARARRCQGLDHEGDRAEFLRLVTLAETLAPPQTVGLSK